MAWCSTSLFHFVDGVRTPVKGLVNAGAEPVFAFYLENQVDHQWCQQRALHGKLRVHELREHQELLSFALLASEQAKWSVINTMLFKCDRNEAAFNRHTPHFLKIKFVRWRLCLVHNPPASIGYRGFRGRSRSQHWGWSVTLVGPSARCQQRQNLAFTQRTARNTPSIQEEGEEHIFRVREFQFLLGKICVAHSVAHSFTLLLWCASSIKVEIPPAGPRRYSKYRRSSLHMSPLWDMR